MVTPASMCRSWMRRCAIALTAASATRSLTPSVTVGSATSKAAIVRPSSRRTEGRPGGRTRPARSRCAPGRAPRAAPAVEGEDPRVDLADMELPLGGIARGLGLDDPLDRPVGGADDAPVSPRVFEHRGGDRPRRPRPRVRIGQPAQRLRGDSGTSPASTITVLAASIWAAAALTASAVPRGCSWTAITTSPSSTARKRPVGRIDDHDRVRAQLARRGHGPRDHRPPTQRVRELWRLPSASACPAPRRG